MTSLHKLPMGLSLACLMMMSSCSKEDALSPEPKIESVNTSSDLRGGVISAYLPYLAGTNGQPGLDIYPLNWERNNTNYFSTNSVTLPTGTSSLTQLWGNSVKWAKPLETIPTAPKANSVVTVTTKACSWAGEFENQASVKTKIKNLIPGKRYAITYYVASSIHALQDSNGLSSYATKVRVSLSDEGHGGGNYYVDLTGIKAEWVAQTVTYAAGSTEADLAFSAITQKGKYAYAHIFVDKNSIIKLD
ncbi:MAG: hypothetical protein ABIN80_24670 [Dyadobacter sp.]|uniref:hypothetical protein n=1 Tax=Dyadobacter sp. TaxID=1914288 RepID=UPI0032669768